ncbi:MAG: hypothetical protein HFF84_02240 [Oscillibacter sp.]|nr:hypothetical protein [Oscillibacter sp.]
MNELQKQLEQCGNSLVLAPGEYEGPIRVVRPCVIDGGGATVWAACGPVLTVASRGVILKNLRVEVTETGAANRTAVRTEAADTVFDQVEVGGDVEGVPGEPPHWDLPSLVSLGEFAAGAENVFSIPVQLAGPAELACTIGGVTVSPVNVPGGRQRISLKTDELRDNTVLYGEILVRSRVIRHICVTGRAKKGVPIQKNVPATIPANREPVQVSAPVDLLAPSALDESVPYMARGQRVGAPELGKGVVKVALEYQGTRVPMELDSYIFLLQKNGKVRGDSDFVFFGNPESPDHAVRFGSSGMCPLALASLEQLDASVERLAVCYSIYGEEPGKNFSQVQEPLLRIFAGERELYRLKLDRLTIEKTLVAVEIYRHKGQWKVNFVASGYRDGLRRLCESYGVEVE